MILLCSLFAMHLPSQYASKIVLILTMVLGFQVIISLNTRKNTSYNNKYVFTLSKISFVYVVILFLLYKINSTNMITGYGIFRMLAYSNIFIFIAYMQSNNTVDNNIIRKLLYAFIYTYYIYYNVWYYVNYEIVPHNAYIACLGLILYSDTLYKLIYKNISITARMVLILVILILIMIPILAVLRGATITLFLITLIQLFYIAKTNKLRIVLAIFVLILGIIVLSSQSFEHAFTSQANIYGYTKPQDIITSITREDRNRDVRIFWYNEIVTVLRRSPIWGTVYEFRFSPFGIDEATASGLHNYYASMLVDTGLVAFMLYLIIIVRVYKRGNRSIIAGNTVYIKYICWNIAIMSTLFTNCFGHVWRTSGVLALLHAYAIVQLGRANLERRTCPKRS